jgi:hypothetical protein
VTLAVTGSSISSHVFRRCRMTVFQMHRLPLTGKSMEHTLGERSWNDADCLCFSGIQRGGYGKVL